MVRRPAISGEAIRNAFHAPVVRYACAALLTVLATVVRLALSGLLGDGGPFVTFYAASAVAAYYLGLGPAILTTLLGGLLTAYMFLPPVFGVLLQSRQDAVWLFLYFVTALTGAIAIESRRREQERAKASAKLAESRYENLQREIAARHAAEQSEERQRQWATVTLSSIGDAVITTDAGGTVTFMNGVAESLTGWNSLDAVGRPIHEIFDIVNEVTGGPAEVPVEEVLATGLVKGLANHTELVARDGRRTAIDDSAAPIRDSAGNLIGVVLVFRDVTDRREREKALQRTNEDLKRFAYVASHDLQEPLRMVASFVELLRVRYAGKLDPEADGFIQFAVDGARRMQALVRDLLEYSRTGSDKLQVTTVDLEELLKLVLTMLQDRITAAGAAITHDALPQVPADEVKVGQILQNLIGNALKFRGEAPTRIHVGAVHRDHEWVFSVQDNGIGFDPKYAEQIFLMFARLNPRATHEGTGIGLAISKRLVEAHGGRIWAESAVGAGSTFYFTLPAAAVRAARHPS